MSVRKVDRYTVNDQIIKSGLLHQQLNKMVDRLNNNQDASTQHTLANEARIATLESTTAAQAAQIQALQALAGTLGTELQPVITATTKKKKA